MNKAVSSATAGDTIYMRGGSYAYNATQNLNKSGAAGALFNLFAYTGEHPVIDFSSQPVADASRGFLITGNYWYLKGLEIGHAGDNGIKLESGNCTLEMLTVHHSADTGIQAGNSTTPSAVANNLILNCDSYRNYDRATSGGNADGIDIKLGSGVGNVIRGCRCWENSDDGYDLYDANQPITIESCWAWHNGDPALFGAGTNGWAGNGNGFKLGSANVAASHTVKNCVAFDHVYGDGTSTTKGFDQNNNTASQTIYNCTAWNNKVNYSFPAAASVLKNDVGFAWTQSNTNLASGSTQQNDSWTLPVTADTADFQSLSATDAAAPRQADGSLPVNGFAKLVLGSDLIDKGVNVGIAYCGAAPDLGAFESC